MWWRAGWLAIACWLACALPCAAALFSGAPGPVSYTTSTLTNYNGGGTAATNQISHYDTDGNKLEISSGNILQVGTTFYAYGEDYSCGFQYGNSTTTYCGVNVYSSTDLIKWHNLGHPFNAAVAYWQNRCTGSANAGCYRPHMAYNAANNNYVLWINQSNAATTVVADTYIVQVCSTPYGSCGAPTEPSGLAHGPINGDENLFVDPQNTANAYLIYKNLNNNLIYIDQLNSAFTDSTGATLQTPANNSTEAPFMFYVSGGNYFIGWGPNCTLCSAGANTFIASATTPMGTYGNQDVINSGSGSCNGQPRSLDVINGNGTLTYLYSTDQWNGLGNQGLANTYFTPLTISGTSITHFGCSTTVTVPGMIADNATLPVPTDTYLANADTSTSTWRMQTFVAAATTISTIKMPLGQANQNCTVGSSCPGGLNADPIIRVVTLDGSNNPVTTLGSVTVSAASLSWGENLTTLTFNLSGLSVSTKYGVVVTNQGSQGVPTTALYNGATNPSPSNVERISTNSGSTWTTETNSNIQLTVNP